MKVELIVSRSGADGAFAPGDIIDVSKEEATRMIKAGQCKPVRGGESRETTTKVTKREKAVK